jgi:hypothetical protein
LPYSLSAPVTGAQRPKKKDRVSGLVGIAPVRESAPKFCAPMCDRSARRQCDSPPPSSGPDHVHRIRHGLRIVCRRPCPPYRLGARTHRNAPLSRTKGRGVYPNPWRPRKRGSEGLFLRRSVARPRGLWSVAPATGAAATTELPPLLPRCCLCCRPAAVPLLELHDAPLLPPRGATFGMECDGSLGSGPDQPDQHPTNTRPTRPNWYGHQVFARHRVVHTTRPTPDQPFERGSVTKSLHTNGLHQPDQPDQTSPIVFLFCTHTPPLHFAHMPSIREYWSG